MDESASSQSRVEIDSDDSDSEADELMPRAFQIEQDLTDDLSQPPTTGEQFLRRVHLTNDEAWRKLCLGDDELSSRDTATYPSYELLCSWDQKTICTVLAKMGRWNMAHKPHSVIVRRLQWCFSLLVCLDRLFTMETAFILRELLRSMLRERRKLPNETLDNSEHLAGADLIITLIAHYFDQSDVLRET
ncbi:hypothetical protein CAOG_07887 [Capsaspora owczarzaki ATCC 30864]|uniref:hypothetical protein n=1 Tax=Capsaspora owczarzaki (strain ATCC 30864) TaxID=595528 RepID=UPI0001FE41AB|nr:hypothetical protein CAOG_07887 [Capsaspora owczarzaki ATCC 30864]|eukprot:XP_004342972.1 hypothetical protein CAOG_07887 [Capsaspora owczarzaki ATCC 30864]